MLIVRTDASETIGIGHVVRCIALAEAWRDAGGEVTFALERAPAPVVAMIERCGARVEWVRTIADTVALVERAGARHAIIDGYHVGADWQSALAAVARLLVVDDRGETATGSAAIVLNPNPYATADRYAGLGARVLAGRDYALLRREFRTPAPVRAVPDVARRVLVSFGGADPARLTPRAIEAVAGFDAVVVVGPANPHAIDAQRGVEVVASAQDMAARMHWADLAIVAAGGTCWELAACGTPAIAIVVADNQIEVGAAVVDHGVGRKLDRDATAAQLRDAITELAHDHATRAEMARRGPALIDGRGALRACAALRDDAGAR